MVTKDIDQENSLKGNVQEKLKGVDYELPIIRETPDPLKRWRLNLVQADEEKLILDYIGASYSMYLGSMLMFGGGIIIFLAFDDIIDMFKFIIREHSFTLDHLFLSCICFSFFILGFIPVFIQLIGPRKRWIFNRKTKMVTVPGKFFVKEHQLPFDQIYLSDECSNDYTQTGSRFVYPAVMIPMEKGLFRYFKSDWVFLEQWSICGRHKKAWSFYTWYMDNNRPLPPGSAFDHCREREFEQRKAKGFPLPEYFSYVPTPEANPSFQAEREKVWSDAVLGGDKYKYGKVDLLNDIYPQGSFNSIDNWSNYLDPLTPEVENYHWQNKILKYKDHFRLAPKIGYVRFVFENGEIGYSSVNALKKYLAPTKKGLKYKVEYIYDNYIDERDYYQEIWKRQQKEKLTTSAEVFDY